METRLVIMFYDENQNLIAEDTDNYFTDSENFPPRRYDDVKLMSDEIYDCIEDLGIDPFDIAFAEIAASVIDSCIIRFSHGEIVRWYYLDDPEDVRELEEIGYISF